MVWFIAFLWSAAIMLCVAPRATLKVCGVFVGLCGLCVVVLFMWKMGIQANI
jgi:hypothetical protein